MRILIIPGLGGSGPEHWQSHWERSYPGAQRVEQSDWDRPVRSQWIRRLTAAIEDAPGALLVGHSLGCALIAHVAAQRPDLTVAGALLVAPADVDRAGGVSPHVGELAPMPVERLSFRTVVVASANDHYMTAERARILAGAWGARFVNVGPCGHINVPSGFGPWQVGERILNELMHECRASARERASSEALPPSMARRRERAVRG
jgi:predicted alpha/beta hydrolase family esterase